MKTGSANSGSVNVSNQSLVNNIGGSIIGTLSGFASNGTGSVSSNNSIGSNSSSNASNINLSSIGGADDTINIGFLLNFKRYLHGIYIDYLVNLGFENRNISLFKKDQLEDPEIDVLIGIVNCILNYEIFIDCKIKKDHADLKRVIHFVDRYYPFHINLKFCLMVEKFIEISLKNDLNIESELFDLFIKRFDFSNVKEDVKVNIVQIML